MVKDTLIEEFIEDTRRLVDSLSAWTTRWASYGKELEAKITPSQRKKIERVFKDFAETIDKLQTG